MFFVVLATSAPRTWCAAVGRAFIAIRDQDIAAEIIGINIFRYKLLAFAISSFYAGVTGVVYTYYLGIADYEQFQLDVSVDYLAMIIIGGLGSIPGDLGAVFVTLLPIVIRWLLELRRSVLHRGRSANLIPNLRLVMFGGLIIFFLVVEPEGLTRCGETSEITSGCGHSHTEQPKQGRTRKSRYRQCATGGNAAVAAAPRTSPLRRPSKRKSWSARNATAPARLRSSASVICPAIGLFPATPIMKGGSTAKDRPPELDNEYKVPPAVEAYERQETGRRGHRCRFTARRRPRR